MRKIQPAWPFLLGLWTFPLLAAGPGEDPFAAAALEAERSAAAFLAAHRTQKAWAERADARTGLLPQNLRSPHWTPANSAADLYPFLALTASYTDRAAFEGRWREVLMTEIRLTSRLGPLPDDYALELSAFTHPQADLERIIFGSSEYVKDGLMPITELLGPSPWFARLRAIADAIIERSPVASRFGPLPSDGAEVNGNLLQSLSRLFWATADRRYLEAGERILRAYLEEVLPASNGLPVHRWDFQAHAPLSDVLSLNDHGNEVIGGLAEFTLTLDAVRPEAAAPLRPVFLRMVDRLLEIARNPDGLWFSRLRPRTGEVLDRRTPDTWGYALTAVYMAHLLTGEERYRTAVRRALSALEKPDYLEWDGADSFADSIEGCILLANREPVPEALAWIDRILPRFLALQRPDGIVEGWHGDGNFARTALMAALMKTRGASLHPWREDLRLGAVQDGERLYLFVRAESAWEGVLRLDRARYREFLHLPLNYPRLNEFPVWFAADPARIYRIAGIGDGRRASGIELQEGLRLRLEAGEELRIEVRPESVEESPPPPPVLGEGGLLLEVEEFAGPWRTQVNYPGYSGRGFRVSNASGIAGTMLRRKIRVAAGGDYAIWARGLTSPGGDRAFSVEIGGKRFGPTHSAAERTEFRWERCGSARLEPGEAEIIIRDEGAGFECPDALFLSSNPEAPLPGDPAAPPPSGSDSGADRGKANLDRLRALAEAEASRRRQETADAAGWMARRARLGGEVRRALGLDPEPPRGPLGARIAGTLERDGYRVEKVIFESRPGMPVPANLYLPAGDEAPRPPWPAVLCPVGHWGLSKAEPVVQARAVGFAKLGLAALTYDPVGQGERAIPGNEHSVAFLAALTGESNMTYMVWDSIRALDYLKTRADIDAGRLGVTGCSGGGLNTLYLMAADPRPLASAPVGYICTFSSFLGTGITHCPCSHVPRMGLLTDMDEIVALSAPRPVLVMGGLQDRMFTAAGTREAVAGIRRLYGRQEADGAVELFLDDCGHDYSRPMRERAYGFFLRELAGRGSGEPIPEPMAAGWRPETPADLACFPGGRVPEDSLTYRRSVLGRIAAGRGRSAAEIRARIRELLPAPRIDSWKRGAPEEPAGAEIIIDEDGFEHRAIARGGEDAPAAVLVIDDAGLTPGTPALLEAIASGARRALAVEPPLWSETGDRAHLAATNGLLLGRPLAYLWARAILGHALAERAAGRRVSMMARGPAASAVALLVLIADAGACDALAAAGGPSCWADLAGAAIHRPGALLPGAGLSGDIADLLRAAAPRRVLWSGSTLRADLPLPVEVREREATAVEAAAWLENEL